MTLRRELRKHKGEIVAIGTEHGAAYVFIGPCEDALAGEGMQVRKSYGGRRKHKPVECDKNYLTRQVVTNYPRETDEAWVFIVEGHESGQFWTKKECDEKRRIRKIG